MAACALPVRTSSGVSVSASEVSAREAEELLEEVEMDALQVKLRLIAAQRQLSAAKCQQFLDYLEHSSPHSPSNSPSPSPRSSASTTRTSADRSLTQAEARFQASLAHCGNQPGDQPDNARAASPAATPYSPSRRHSFDVHAHSSSSGVGGSGRRRSHSSRLSGCFARPVWNVEVRQVEDEEAFWMSHEPHHENQHQQHHHHHHHQHHQQQHHRRQHLPQPQQHLKYYSRQLARPSSQYPSSASPSSNSRSLSWPEESLDRSANSALSRSFSCRMTIELE